MHELEENPVLWFADLGRGLLALFLLQLLTGYWTVSIIRSSLSKSAKLPVCLAGITFLTLLSSTIFHPSTHLLGCMIGAVSMVFTSPLQAAAWVQRKTSSPSEKTSDIEIILRIAIPASLPNPKYPLESPSVQLLRGISYISVAALSRRHVARAVDEGGLFVDAFGLFFVLSSTTGTLNFTSAVLGAFGVRSPSPFRAPLLSPSVGSFWSGRWNAPVSDSLRIGVYEPLRRLHGWSRASATLACFIVSGVCHEIILIYCGVYDSRGEWFCFFMLCGLATVLEKKVHQYITGRWAQYVGGVVCLSVLFHVFFAPVALRTGFAKAGVRAIGAGPELVHFLLSSYT